ncbi:efflux RND transporter periplasmic adaptor subunit [Paenibacillus kribbensis]|uniref:efflux RND transporter periplasmic adaptor subunit n=1 Tax=Paenibacillus kribbensis TaxID=172713 RepID=UPI000B1AAEB6|nr:efflux RND transporter periplasmic adaptor subunit [Paenibacillus kribbensis]
MLKFTLYISVIFILLFSSACSSTGLSQNEAAEQQKQKVEAMVVKKEPLSASFNLSGTLQPYDETIVSFELSGLIRDTLLDVGDSVSKGQVMTKLDSSSYQLQLEQADTAILEARAGIKNATAAISSADASIQSAGAQKAAAQAGVNKVNKGAREQERAQVRTKVQRAQSALTKAQATAERTKLLYDQGAATKNDYENTQLALTNASKDLEDAQEALSLIQEGATLEDRQSAESSLRQAQAGKESAIAAKEQAEASKDNSSAAYEQALIAKKQAELALSKTSLKAPISGVILEKKVNAGQLASAGQPVYRIGQIDQLKVLLPVPDYEIKNWQPGQTVRVQLYNESREGTVSQIYPATNSNTGSINVEVIIPNSKHDWAPGQVVKADRQLSQSEQIMLPAKAVVNNGTDTFVYKVVGNKAVKTVVNVGQMSDNKLEITKGLRVGERVVTTGVNLIYDGLALQVTEGTSK